MDKVVIPVPCKNCYMRDLQTSFLNVAQHKFPHTWVRSARIEFKVAFYTRPIKYKINENGAYTLDPVVANSRVEPWQVRDLLRYVRFMDPREPTLWYLEAEG